MNNDVPATRVNVLHTMSSLAANTVTKHIYINDAALSDEQKKGNWMKYILMEDE